MNRRDADETDTPTRASMHTVVLKKADLIKRLTENRETHRAAFDQAMEDYHVAAIKLLEEHIERVKKNVNTKVYVVLDVPEDHTSDYDRILLSLELSIFDEVELTMNEFEQYVRDNWSWKNQWNERNIAYAGISRGV